MRKILFLSIFSFLLIAGTANATSMGFTDYNGHWYSVFVGGAVTWDEASNIAHDNYDGYLVSITTEAENDFVYGLVKNAATGANIQTDQIWLGGYQENNNAEPDGNWAWDSGEAWGYAPWYGGEPNNWNAGNAGSDNFQDYLHYWPPSGGPVWDDMHLASSMVGYVVETDVAPVPEPATLLLLGSGLIGLAGFGRKFRKKM